MNDRVAVSIDNIEDKSLDTAEALAFVDAGANGAQTLFVGVVRNHNMGQSVLGVSYDVFNALAIQSFYDICQEAQEKWGDSLRLYVSHIKGRLEVGGISIVIAAGSPHRDEAFKACRYVIDEIKHRSPIWKLEHYVDGDSEWTQGCELCEHND